MTVPTKSRTLLAKTWCASRESETSEAQVIKLSTWNSCVHITSASITPQSSRIAPSGANSVKDLGTDPSKGRSCQGLRRIRWGPTNERKKKYERKAEKTALQRIRHRHSLRRQRLPETPPVFIRTITWPRVGASVYTCCVRVVRISDFRLRG
ncbi:hypothetical protein HPB48_000152 [Haemaphysalis longicornis]|uniref:Uncharacterized protein n=1 Tax=Haemaphysalis longicornis TaxID=44386 RepID=A0A9J6G4Q6_HAELO|nr:hypothetical protein HPB48_000152 [Haemaphysalis longicornis]